MHENLGGESEKNKKEKREKLEHHRLSVIKPRPNERRSFLAEANFASYGAPPFFQRAEETSPDPPPRCYHVLEGAGNSISPGYEVRSSRPSPGVVFPTDHGHLVRPPPPVLRNRGEEVRWTE